MVCRAVLLQAAATAGATAATGCASCSAAAAARLTWLMNKIILQLTKQTASQLNNGTDKACFDSHLVIISSVADRWSRRLQLLWLLSGEVEGVDWQ
jgi:hypothetical protein